MNIKDIRQEKAGPVKLLRAENTDLRKQLRIAEEAVMDMRRAKPPPQSPDRPGSLRADHARVFCGDFHGYAQDPKAVAPLLADLKKLQPIEICLLGDMIDCGGFLAQHHTMGFVAETRYSFADDVAAANDFLTRLQEACPDARIIYLEGNHEHRIERWCVTETLAHEKDARMLFNLFSPRAVLELERRGIRYISSGEMVKGVSIRGTFRYGKTKCPVYATHGISCRKHAAAYHVERFGGNVVYGHTHRADSFLINTVATTIIGGWSPGCLCKRVRLWNHNQPDNWSTGYHLQLVSRSGRFQPINVGLVKGQSLLHSLLS